MSESEQNMVKEYRIFLGGAGIGSIVAECDLVLSILPLLTVIRLRKVT